MPRSLAEIIANANDLADRFERHDPDLGAVNDASALREVARSSALRAAADAAVLDAVTAARADGHSWAAIGAMLGTSGEAARQRYVGVGAGAGSPASHETNSPPRTGSQATPTGAVRSIANARSRWYNQAHRTTKGGVMANERTGKKAASNAGRTVGAKKATKAAKSAAGSALSQTKSSGVTSKKAAANAGTTLGAKKATKAAKSAAGSALTQRPTKKAATRKK